MFLSDLIGECNESAIVHHASGFLPRERALASLTANGLPEAKANELLDAPVDPKLFDQYKTWPCTGGLLPVGSGPVDPCRFSSTHEGPCISKSGVRFNPDGAGEV